MIKTERKARGYSLTSLVDSKNVAFLSQTFTTHNLKPDLKCDDKHPNLDGTVSILDEFRVPRYNVSVQIKTLSKDDLENPKATVDLSIFDLLSSAQLPIIYIIVNAKAKIAYWKEIKKSDLVDVSQSQKTKVFYFDKNNSISEHNRKYIECWKLIVSERVKEVNSIEDLFLEQKKLSELLKKSIEGGIEQNTNFTQMHHFLDNFNNFYTTYFEGLKRFLYPKCWKFGLAYTNYTNHNLSFIYFPINYDTNQKQIVEIHKSLIIEYLNQDLVFRSMNDNLIAKGAFKNLSKSIVKDNLKMCINHKLFDIVNNIQANEILFSSIKGMRECLGLEDKNEYGFHELRNGWSKYLPIWIDEVLKLKKITTNHDGSVDPSSIKTFLTNEESQKIAVLVKARIKKGKIKTRSFIIGRDSEKIRLALKSLEFLENKKILKIKNIYPKPQSMEGNRHWIWDEYPKEILRKKLNKIYQHLPDTYDLMVWKHFNQLFEQLKFYAGFDKLIILVEMRNHIKSVGPTYTYYYLSNQGEPKSIDRNIEIYFDEEFPYSELSPFGVGIKLELNGVEYSLTCTTQKGGDYIYEGMPILEISYNILKKRLQKVVKRL